MPAFSDRLAPGESLGPGQNLASPSGRFTLVFQTDGNLVLYKNYRYPNRDRVALWASNTVGQNVRTCVLQTDGNFVLYDLFGRARWSSDTWRYPGSTLRMQDDGNIVIYTPVGSARWASNTVSPVPPNGPIAQGSAISAGQILLPGGALRSPNGLYSLVFQTDGNLVLLRNQPGGVLGTLWSTQTTGRPAEVCILQANGNLALFDGDGNWHWISNTPYYPGSLLSLQDDGNLALWTPQGQPVWQTATASSPGPRFDELCYVMHHNTYQQGRMMGPLDRGIRALELDVVDTGDWQPEPDGPFVSHDANITPATLRLGQHLRDITGWMDQHPGQGPVLVFVDLKTVVDLSDVWSVDKVDRLDRRIQGLSGGRLFTTDDLYRHATGTNFVRGGKTLRQAVSERGWPSVSSLRDRIIVFYTGGLIKRVNQNQGAALAHILSLPDRSLPFGFFCPDVEADPQELEPGSAVDGISVETSQFLVGANMEATDHYQITANRAHRHHQVLHLWGEHVYNNGEYVYNYLALAHGVSVIGRDANITETYGGKVPLIGLRRSLPGYFELHPVHAPARCMDVSGGGSANGTPLVLWDANGGDNQRFVYTAEGQLRPKHVNPQGVDISGGDAGEGKRVHLWDCDGGDSEKWVIQPNGAFLSFEDRSFCLAVASGGTTNGTVFITSRANGGTNQRFYLYPAPDWPQTEF